MDVYVWTERSGAEPQTFRCFVQESSPTSGMSIFSCCPYVYLQATYDIVAACMEAHRGNVADCRAEWKEFRSCHREHQKKLKKKNHLVLNA